MYRSNNYQKTSIKVNESFIGETIEEKVNRIVNNNEPIKDGAPLIYEDRNAGINPDHDMRTDKWDIAAETTGKMAQNTILKRGEMTVVPKEETSSTDGQAEQGAAEK